MRSRSPAGGALAAIALCISATLAEAQDGARHDVQIPAQALGSAIATLARQTHCQIIYSSDLVAGRAAPALNGSMTLEQALGTLLDQSGLSFEFLDAHTVTLARVEPQPIRTRDDTPPPSSRQIERQVPAAAADEAVAEVVITGSSIRGAAPVGSSVITVGE